jgi:hypothetical protein
MTAALMEVFPPFPSSRVPDFSGKALLPTLAASLDGGGAGSGPSGHWAEVQKTQCPSTPNLPWTGAQNPPILMSLSPTNFMLEPEHETLLSSGDGDPKCCPHCARPYNPDRSKRWLGAALPCVLASVILVIASALGALAAVRWQSVGNDPSLQLYCELSIPLSRMRRLTCGPNSTRKFRRRVRTAQVQQKSGR